ncbi:MAG: hypothetical protein ACI83N_001980 [Hydrogenophaga sp.]|jgi:hypothetical protein
MGLSNLFARGLLVSALLTAIAGCASSGVNLGFSLPIGRSVGVGVSVGSDGRIGTSVGVGVGGGSLSVGTSGQLGQLPVPARPQREKKSVDR